jgi:hypothetical protein
MRVFVSGASVAGPVLLTGLPGMASLSPVRAPCSPTEAGERKGILQ